MGNPGKARRPEGETVTESKNLRALIVGAGSAAGGHPNLSHAAAYTESKVSSLSGFIEPDAARREFFSEKWGVGSCCGTLNKWKENNADVDIVSVCSPTESHSEALEELLTWNIKAVWCEKPITPSLEASRSIVKSFKDRGILFAVNYSRRWIPRLWEVREEIKCGKWGEFYGATAFYNKGILHNGSHMIDLLNLLIGPTVAERVTRVHASWRSGDPTLDAIVLNTEGVPIHIIAAYPTDVAHFELKLFFEHGELCVERSGQTLRARSLEKNTLTPDLKTLPHGTFENLNISNVFHAALSNIEDAISHSYDLKCDGSIALDSQEVCQQLLTMAREF